MQMETLKAAVENNQFAFVTALKKWDKIRIFDEDTLLYTRSAVAFPFFNSHFRLRAPYQDSIGLVGRAVRYSIKEKLPVCWYTGPQTKPQETGEVLLSHGFKVEDIAPGMAIALSELPKRKRSKAKIAQVRTGNEMRGWRGVFEQGFRLPGFAAKAFTEAYSAIGFEDDSPAHHFTASLDGEVVGCATVFMGAGAAGIYNIATLKEHRGQGIGAALTLHALYYGLKKGFRVGVLQASTEGLPLYRKLGFHECCTIGIYTYRPEAD